MSSAKSECLWKSTTVWSPEVKSLAKGYDVVICSKALINVFDGLDLPNTKVIGLQNLLSEKEITEKLAENGIGA